MARYLSLPGLLVTLLVAVPCQAREWVDATGKYSVEADLIAFNDTTVVLKTADHRLLAVPIDKLSSEDHTYLKSQEAIDTARKGSDAVQTWTMRGGYKVVGKVVSYGRKEVTIQRRRGKIYVNEHVLDNLPAMYRDVIVPKIVAHFENTPIDDLKALEAWVLKLHGEPRTYTCEGVLLELENGDEYPMPFFFFSDEDLKVLQPGWKEWQATENDRLQREHHSFLLQSQAQAYQQDRQIQQQMSMLQLQMQAVDAGITDLWEVQLFPQGRGYPMCVVVPARDSRMAAQTAMARNPGYVAGATVRVNHRRR